MSVSKRSSLLAAAVILVVFVVLRWPLLRGNGQIDGTNADTSVIALMGKKMLEGRGFDVFCWGVGHLGPLTSLITAAWALPLMKLAVAWPWPLAVRLASMTEVAGGIALIAWSAARIDRRAAFPVALALAIGPPDLFSMSVFPLGHEMAFLLGAAVLAIATQHWTSIEGRGWLASSRGRLFLGVVGGVGWWMNRTMAFALAGTLIVAALRSSLFARARTFALARNRRKLPGVIEAFVFLFQWSGLTLIAIYTAGDLFGFGKLPFVLGPMMDGVTLLAIAWTIVLLSKVRTFRLAPEEWRELRNLGETTVGFAIGCAPAWLANLLNWYPRAYSAGLSLQPTPRTFLSEVSGYGPSVLYRLLGIDAQPAGIAFAIALALLLLSTLVRHRRDVAAYLQLTPSREWGARTLFASIVVAALAAIFLVDGIFRSRYLLAAAGPLFALATLEGLRWWDSQQKAKRAGAALAFGSCLVTFTCGALVLRSVYHVMANPIAPVVFKADPLIVLSRVDAFRCRVNYVYSGIAYDYRLLTEDRGTFITWLGGHDQTPLYSRAAQALPGQRCFIDESGVVFPIPGDLPLQGKGRVVPARPGSLRK